MFYFRSGHTMSWRVGPCLARIAMVVVGSAVLLLLGIYLQSLLTEPDTADGPTYYSTQTGEHTFVWLEDSLTVTVNTASRIAIDPGKGHRVHLLQGEAPFRGGPTSRGL